MLFNKEGQLVLNSLQELLQTYYMATGVSIMAVDKSGNPVLFQGNAYDFCRLLEDHCPNAYRCREAHLDACKYAINIGEPYFFFCPRDFINVAVPLIYNDTFWGGLIAGPIIAQAGSETNREEYTLDKLSEGVPSGIKPELKEKFDAIPVTDPIRANYLGSLLYMLAAQEMEHYEDFLESRKQKMQEQNKISEEINRYKNLATANSHLHNMELQLFAKVKSGNLDEAKEILTALQACIYVEEGNNIDIIKVRMMELCSLLSRAAMEGGADSRRMLAFNYSLFGSLNSLHTLEDISYWMQRVLEYYIDNVIELPDFKNTAIVKEAINYINHHFSEPLQLEEVAAVVHLNPTYFSTVFKKATGKPFVAYLQQLRIEESKLLLTTTDDSIIDIAIATGFNSQGYFTKVFGAMTGMTPKEYRKKHGVAH